MKALHELRDLADQAQAENESGVVAGDEGAQRYLDGVEQALRWAAGDGSTTELDALLDRMRRSQVTNGGDALVGKTVSSVEVTTVEGAWGDEPATRLHFDDGTEWTFVHPQQER